MVDLRDATEEQIQAELKRREQSRVPKPMPANDSDWSNLRDLIINNIEVMAEDGYKTKDVEHYAFEYAMEAVYGEHIWNWYNEQLK